MEPLVDIAALVFFVIPLVAMARLRGVSVPGRALRILVTIGVLFIMAIFLSFFAQIDRVLFLYIPALLVEWLLLLAFVRAGKQTANQIRHAP